ncbi:unnamed protein product [Paramecium octaurelia]|uniref:Smr domain-containing protein n=1 Tax=Paramecium octaurelia TaxID=43137 RepID=A0A8S1UVM2_PAROT|nr:unnamed protein product [Paramecium octaurelia]
MIALFLGLHFTLLRFLFYWTLYAIYTSICYIFELKLSILEYLLPIIFEVIYIIVYTTLSLKWYLISQLFNLLWNLISIACMIISQIFTFLVLKKPQQSAQPDLTLGQFAISGVIIFALILTLKYQFEEGWSNEISQYYRQRRQARSRIPNSYYTNYYFGQTQSYAPTSSYSPKQPRSYSQNNRQQSQKKNNRQFEEEERKNQLTLELNENREMMRCLYQNKANLYQLKKNKEITKSELKSAMEIYDEKIEVLQITGKALFLNLINVQDGLCRVDFHNFYKAEIKGLVDGLLQKIRLYQYEEGWRQVKLKIIVGKGNHSKNGIPVIGPLTQELLNQYLQEDVEIRNGVIEVQV